MTLLTPAYGRGVAWRRSKWRASTTFGGFVFVLAVVVVLRGRAVSFTGGERSRRGDVTSSRARTSPRALLNPHTPGRTFTHHPALSDFPIAEVPFDANYVTEFTGLRVKYQWDCTNGADSEGFGYYDVVPSRRFKCREHADATREGTKSYTPDLPIADDEYSQWYAIAEALESTPENAEFVYVELGARWGTWVSRAATFARTLRPDITFKGWAVESSEKYVSHIKHTLEKNNLRNLVTVSHALATPKLVKEFISKAKFINLLDSDIQGAEFDLFEDEETASLLFQKVKRLQIGTHDNARHVILRDKLRAHGWDITEDELGGITSKCDSFISRDEYERAFRENCTTDSPFGPVYVRDGVIGARNPQLMNPSETSPRNSNVHLSGCPSSTRIAIRSIPNEEIGWKTMHVYVGDASAKSAQSSWRSFSQSKQDSVVRVMAPRGGYFIDLAANDWQKDSNTYALETFDDWNGLCVEPNDVYWSGLVKRKCTLVAAVVGGAANEIVKFASTKGGLGGIVAANMDNALEVNNLKEFYTTTIDSIFSTFDVPDAIDYLSLDIEGAESVVFPLLPFHTHAIHIMTIERPKEDVRAMLKAQKYVEVGIMGDYGDSMYLHSETPNFHDVLRVGQMEVMRQHGSPTSEFSIDDDFKPIRHNNLAIGVRCPYHMLDACGGDLVAWDASYEEIVRRLRPQR